MNKNLLIAIKSSIAAGKAILEIYNRTDFEIEKKSDDSPLTIADKKAHKIITKYLNETGIPVLSEEGKNIPFNERSKWEQYWLVDPLDGTKEFINRNGEFTVNIALIKDNTPILGVIYVPVTKDLYFSDQNLGAFKAINVFYDTDISLIQNQSFKLPLLMEKEVFSVIGSRSHMNSETEEFIEKLKLEHGEIEFITKGSSLKFCMVAEGLANIYPRFGPTMEWDTAAGHAIAVGSGCIVSLSDNKTALLYNKQELLNPWFVVKR